MPKPVWRLRCRGEPHGAEGSAADMGSVCCVGGGDAHASWNRAEDLTVRTERRRCSARPHNGLGVKLRGQGPRAEGSAAHGLPACEARDAGRAPPSGFDFNEALQRRAEAGPRRLLRRVRPRRRNSGRRQEAGRCSKLNFRFDLSCCWSGNFGLWRDEILGRTAQNNLKPTTHNKAEQKHMNACEQLRHDDV